VHQITYDNALALAIGSNIGSTVTAVIGSLSANIQGKRLAGAHLLFNLLTGIIALIFIKEFIIAVDRINAALGIAVTDNTLKLATFHSLFNLVGVAIMLPFMNRLVALLEKIFVEKRPNLFRPKYLNPSAIGFPETVAESVRLETIHLYEHGIHIILHAFGLRKRNLSDQSDLKQLIKQNNDPVEYDIDAGYEKRIKGIYSAIIAFIGQANTTWEMKQSPNLALLRDANRTLVEAIKDTKHLQKNWVRSRTSKNQVTIDEYKKIAYQIVSLIQQIEQFRREIAENELPLLSLDVLKAMIEDEDMRMNRSIDTLIRERKITPETGSSLINDSTYMYNIKKNLIKTAETLFVHDHANAIRIERQLALSEAEIRGVVQAVDAQ
jgi:phosphate:Na+ symporter